MRMRLGLIFLAGVLAACVAGWNCPVARAAGLDLTVTQFLPPDANFLAGIEWRRTLGASFGKALQEQLAKAGASAVPQFEALRKTLAEDVDAAYITSSARDFSSAGGQTPMLIVVKGRFNPAATKSWLQGKTEFYRNVALTAPENVKPPSMRIAYLDEGTLLFGDRAEVTGAIDRMMAAGGKRVSGRTISRAEGLAGRYDIWLLMNVPPDAARKSGGPPAASQFLALVNGMEVGLSFSNGFELAANLRPRSEQNAKPLGDLLRGLVAMASLNQQTPETQQVLNKIQISEEPTLVSISLALSQEEMKELTARMQATPAKQSGAPAQAPRRQEPRNNTIRIYGQDSGPVEIPVPSGAR